MFYFALVALIFGVIVSLVNGNHKLQLVVLLIGLGLFFAPIGIWKMAGIALLAAIIWTANKLDM